MFDDVVDSVSLFSLLLFSCSVFSGLYGISSPKFLKYPAPIRDCFCFLFNWMSILSISLLSSSSGLPGTYNSLPRPLFHCGLIAPGLASSVRLLTNSVVSGDFSLLLIIAIISSSVPQW